MDVKALVAVAETDETFPITFPGEPAPGEIIPLTADGVTSDYVIVDVDPTGFDNSVPYLYQVYVKHR